MKIKIEYEINSTFYYPKVAKTKIKNSEFWSSGKTWEEAKESLLKQVSEYLSELEKAIPPPEEVEI